MVKITDFPTYMHCMCDTRIEIMRHILSFSQTNFVPLPQLRRSWLFGAETSRFEQVWTGRPRLLLMILKINNNNIIIIIIVGNSLT